MAVAGGNLGDILIPAAVGALIGYVNPQAFVYCTFSAVVISAVLITILFGLTFLLREGTWNLQLMIRKAIRSYDGNTEINDDFQAICFIIT